MEQQKNIGQVSKLIFGDEVIKYYKNPIILNQTYKQDIIPGVYEGGFQLWQCEIEFLKKIFQVEELKNLFEGRQVIQIGCGHGLLGIAAAKLKAKKIIFQDYNQNVVNQLTKLTVQLNQVQSNVQYSWGDWDKFQNNNSYDIIIGSQLTYREQNYGKIIKFIKNNMKKKGVCILANKSYYFGVGGNLSAFKDQLEKQNLSWKSISKIVPKSGGNKKQIISISFTNTE